MFWCENHGKNIFFNFNYRRHIIALLFAIALFILTNIENHLELTTLAMDQKREVEFVKRLKKYSDLSMESFYYARAFSMLFYSFKVLRWDSKLMFTTALGGSCFIHLLIPTIITHDYLPWLVICYISKGLLEGMVVPFLMTVWSFWAPVMENTTLMAISLFGYFIGRSLQVNIFFTLSDFQFDVPFYIFGAIGISWAVVCLLFVNEKPLEEHNVSPIELERISRGDNDQGITTFTSAIKNNIFKSVPTLSIPLLVLCSEFNIFIVANIIFPPEILITRHVLLTKFVDCYTYSYLTTAFVVILVALLSDHFRHNYCPTKTRKVIICAVLFGSAAIIPFIGINVTKNVVTFLTLFGLFIILQGIALLGCLVNALDVAHRAAGYVLGISFGLVWIFNLSFELTKLFVAYLKSGEKHENNFESQRTTFYIALVLNVIVGIVYAFWGSGKREIWTFDDSTTFTSTGKKCPDAPPAYLA